MKPVYLFTSLLCLFFLCHSGSASTPQTAEPAKELLTGKWPAYWITHPDCPPYDYGVYHFRKNFVLDTLPETFIVNVSADNRYRLFINGTAVASGPSRGDIAHWYWDTIDLAPWLQPGQNTLAAQVWNAGSYTPGAQITLKTALIVQGNSPAEEVINTRSGWKVMQNRAYSPSTENRQDVGSADCVHGALYPWDWEQTEYDDSAWSNITSLGRGATYGSNTGYDWVLYPNEIPQMEEKPVRLQRVRRSSGMEVPALFLQGEAPLLIPAHQQVTILLDQNELTNAYPELMVSGGEGSKIKLTYSEALYKEGRKGNRDSIGGYDIRGWSDLFYPDGADNRLFRPLWFRTYRYLQLDIKTADEALMINDLHGIYTAYPFRENGSFESDNPLLTEIWDTGWRTARLCAHETYFDCPYYEQLQYVGDTRIQALISLYVDGDDRLMRKAIRTFNNSRSPEGITTSRYPARTPQYIPPFSLYWINMVHDYYMHRDDTDFVNECIPGVKSIIDWFIAKLDSTGGMLGPLPHWNFVDWPVEWPWNNEYPLGGVPPGGMEGGSSILSLQLAYTLNDAARLYDAFDEPQQAVRCRETAAAINAGVMKRCWNESRGLLADDPTETSYSQHANIMGVLSGAIPKAKQQEVLNRVNSDSSLIQATFYYRFYLTRAMKEAGLADQYIEQLKPWQDMLEMNLTTFAENPEPTRSDCHAWSASPLYDMLATICGIEPASPGFGMVRIAPHPGSLQTIKGRVPHPKGFIDIELAQTPKGLSGMIRLPEGLHGSYYYANRELQLYSGENKITP